MKRVLAILSAFICLIATPSFSANGVITGKVLDSVTRKPLVDVNISLVNSQTGTASDQNGRFHLELKPGWYSLRVERIGYETKIIPNVKLVDSQRLDFIIDLNESVVEMEQVVVTATRNRSLLRELPVFANAISANDLQKIDPMTVGEALQVSNTSFIQQYGGPGAVESVSLRGSTASQVLVLWDGQRINSALSGGFDLGTIPIQSIEKIEIVHGSYSSLYGADAMGGVINLITRSPVAGRGLKSSIHSAIGSYGLQNHVVNLTQNIGALSYLFSGNLVQSDGDFEYDLQDNGSKTPGGRANRQNSNYQSTALFGKLIAQVSPTTILRISGEVSHTDRGVPGSLSFPTVNGFQKDRTVRIHFDAESSPRDHLTWKWGSFYHQSELAYKDENPFWPIESENIARSFGLNAQGTFRVRTNQLTFGASYLHEAGEGSDVGSPQRNNVGLYSQMEVKLAPFSNELLTASFFPSVRYDYYSDFESSINPQIGLLLSKAGETSYGFRANWGKSFHAPTFNDLYWIGDAYTSGNPDLKPERAVSLDYGVRFQTSKLGGLELEVGAFSKSATDLIQWAGDFETGQWTPQNVSAARVVGQDFKMGLSKLGKRISADIRYTHLKATNESDREETNGKLLIYRPSHKLGVTSTLDLKPVTVTFTATQIGSRYADELNRIKLDAILLFDANIAYRTYLMGYSLDLGLSLRNISNEKYQMVYDYPMPGRQWRIKVGLGI